MSAESLSMNNQQILVRRRNSLPAVFTQKGYTSGAEIGVQKGTFSQVISDGWNGRLYLVDAWHHFSDGYDDSANVAQAEQDAIYQSVLERFKDRNVKVIRGMSVDVAATFSDGELDWIYIDANHSYKTVTDDLNAWWPKVRDGGIVSGHDYYNGIFRGKINGEFGVESAVNDFMAAKGLPLPQVTRGKSWVVFKD